MSNGARQFPETGDFAPFCANRGEGVKGATAKPPCRVRGGEIPA